MDLFVFICGQNQFTVFPFSTHNSSFKTHNWPLYSLSTKTKYVLLFLVLAITAIVLLRPNFHPEQALLHQYYWQADVLIHAGYFFGLTFFIASLKFKLKLVHLFLLLGTFSIVLELLQKFSYQRGVSWMDAMDNLIGIGLALIVYHWLNKPAKSPKYN